MGIMSSLSATQCVVLINFYLFQGSSYMGIMSSLSATQCVVFINDHIAAVADAAALETLHQVLMTLLSKQVYDLFSDGGFIVAYFMIFGTIYPPSVYEGSSEYFLDVIHFSDLSQCWQARPWTFIFYVIFI